MTSPAPSWYSNPAARTWRSEPPTAEVAAFHRSFPGYEPTRLVELPAIAAELGVGRVFVKDESSRLGLPAFKILGASYAISRALGARLGTPDAALTLQELRVRLAGRPPVELIAATDGNHGRAVAHVARLLGLPARIFIPEGATPEARDAIVAENAEVTALDLPYDDVVAIAAGVARQAGDAALLIQDTAGDGHDDVPGWIVEGYATLFAEADVQLADAGVRAGLVVVPVGVGSLAQAAVAHYRAASPPFPGIMTVEPESAPAIISSLHAGAPIPVETRSTIMTGLNCGIVSSIAWPILHAGVDAAVTVPDDAARVAVAQLRDLGVDAGPCGAGTLAAARAVLTDPRRRSAVAATAGTVVLLLNTEGLAANPIELPTVGGAA